MIRYLIGAVIIGIGILLIVYSIKHKGDGQLGIAYKIKGIFAGISLILCGLALMIYN